MPKWSVTLSGDPDDLKALVALGVGVTEESNAFVLRSPGLDRLDDARVVHRRAVELVEVFNGLSRIAEGDAKARAVVVAAIFREDGARRDIFVMPDTIEIRLRGRPADLGGRATRPGAHSCRSRPSQSAIPPSHGPSGSSPVSRPR